MRFIGLIIIILAHTRPPSLIFNLRNFDVPLMVLISGASFKLSFNEKESYIFYIWKRINRLIFPVWIFLTFYFIATYFYKSSSLNLLKIVESYFLVGGIGYVWIFRVFILVALVAPFIHTLDKKFKSDSNYLLLLLGIYLFYELIRFYTLSYFSQNTTLKIIKSIIFYIVPYSIIFAFGNRIFKLDTKKIVYIIYLLFLIFLSIGFFIYINEGHFVPTQRFKYPPSIYYSSYALAITLLLWIYSDNIWKKVEGTIFCKKIILFIAQNSLWIYLWHIPFVKIFNFIEINYIIKYVLIIIISSTIVFLQVYIVKNQKKLKVLFLKWLQRFDKS